MRTATSHCLVILTALACATPGAAPPQPGTPAAGPVTAADLLEREGAWPYEAAMLETWQPPDGDRPISKGRIGVLVRVQERGVVRLDFGRLGRHEVPIEATDVVARANVVREQGKQFPNFVLAVGTRLTDTAADDLRPLSHRQVAERPGFLCVFADPTSDGFAAMARQLEPLRERHGVMTILFPLGDHTDRAVRGRLRKLGWPVPFVVDRFSDGYARSLLSDASAVPAVLLQTAEGRLLFEATWSPAAVDSVEAAMDGAFGRGRIAVGARDRAPAER